jgi:hypothetical protein
MPAVKPLNLIVDKWARRAAQAGPDYASGVKQPRRDWQQAASQAEEAYIAGVQQAASEGRYGKGVSEAGTQKWQRKAIAVGAQRYGPGVAAAKSDYQQNFAPFAQVISSVQLPPRGAKGDPRNYEAVRMIGEALHNAKTGGGGA